MIMSNDTVDACQVALIIIFIVITGLINNAYGDSLETDREVLLSLKNYLEKTNLVNRGKYSKWNSSSSPCSWRGITCDSSSNRVTGIDLSSDAITGDMFGNFSALTSLTVLDLSDNSINGHVTGDLSKCFNLRTLNLSRNTIRGELILTSGLSSLEIIDLSTNQISGGIHLSFPAICRSLVVANLSENNFTGSIEGLFDDCPYLQYLDLSTNKLTGNIWNGFIRLKEFSISENLIQGSLASIFSSNCSLTKIDLLQNLFAGQIPKEISYCKDLEILNLWGNNFTGNIPSEIGSLARLKALILGNNGFSSNISDSLLNLKNLKFLDMSNNKFVGEIQSIFGQLTQVKFLVLRSNFYTGGLISSGILNLTNLIRLDLSFNNFTGSLPVEVSQMNSLLFLILANNQFTGNIPKEYGNMVSLQALDLSFNELNGSIPSSFGNLTSLLWLMLANNNLSGSIPPEIGKCNSLLWLNLANNHLSGSIPSELTAIGSDASATFLKNRRTDLFIIGSGDCRAMKRWIPGDYPPFSFVYTLLNAKKCRSLWYNVINGYGLIPVCGHGTDVRSMDIPGYVQISGNKLSGPLPSQIGLMKNFSMLHLGFNQISGELPPQVGQLLLFSLNITQNNFTGAIPIEIGSAKCLQNLDLSYNNFSGQFTASLNKLTELSKFNISYNHYISGVIPQTGQLATFEKDSFLGDPFLTLPLFIDNSTTSVNGTVQHRHLRKQRRLKKFGVFFVPFFLVFAILLCGIISFIYCVILKLPAKSNQRQEGSGSTSNTSSEKVNVIRLDKTLFTHSDILTATCNFSEKRVIGRGGYGTVYHGVLPDGREVAVKKLQREGPEGEREFKAEMEVLSGNRFGWANQNLVTLYGWCLNGSEKLLVYEYLEGGSLDDLISDRLSLTWSRRIDIAIDVAQALVFLHHECVPSIVHRDVKASNVILDSDGTGRVTDFGLARVVEDGVSHVSTMVAGTIGYVAPEYCQTWKATTKGDVYSYGVLALELATGRRAVVEGDECLVDWARRVMGRGDASNVPMAAMVSGLVEGSEELGELIKIGVKCIEEAPQARPNMKEVLAMLVQV
ncbi:probable LRR receptor-like serine/threonine-protein kinase At1g74360 [Impatiens glandulifera]|uniref:probable LRR receptor-like serine/threonine-protein kinase At1g74360 n=1 Tax=Impatiens glandulifera TaxID=253017 RepID=UPI001FB0C8E6|nr:probable LRR receptor-like serine/threonine-protein kinase At1g74360 [Impatiens glandulifera]XP_047329902.1 probable LRR receptor-like serine/threonine-protein kinase At1g74360 [Impatiens glandulifera]